MPPQSPTFLGVKTSPILLIFLAFISLTARANEIKRLMVVTPVYREFLSGNLARLLDSFLNQDNLSQLESLDLIFVVNESYSLSPHVREDNQLALDFLTALARREVPVRHNSLGLATRRLAEQLRNSPKIHIHVIDERGRLPFEANIGALRARGNDYALELAKNQLSSTLIAQFDADSRASNNFARVMQQSFTREELGYALAYLDFDLDPEAGVQGCAKFANYRLRLALRQLDYEVSNNTVAFGTPRIIARADYLAAAGGMPHAPYAEDAALLKALNDLRVRARYIPQVQVTTGYRARADGYDSAHHFATLNEPLALSQGATTRLEALGDFTRFLRDYVPDLLPTLESERAKILAETKQQIADRRRELWAVMSQPHRSLNWNRDPFFSMQWLHTLLSSVRADPSPANKNDAFDELEDLLPQFLGTREVTKAQEHFALVRAASQVVATLYLRRGMHTPRPADYAERSERLIREYRQLTEQFKTARRSSDKFRLALLKLIALSWRDPTLRDHLTRPQFEGPKVGTAAFETPAHDSTESIAAPSPAPSHWRRVGAMIRAWPRNLCEAAATLRGR